MRGAVIWYSLHWTIEKIMCPMPGALIWYSVLFNIDLVEKSTECAVQKTNGLNMQCSANNQLSILCMVCYTTDSSVISNQVD